MAQERLRENKPARLRQNAPHWRFALKSSKLLALAVLGCPLAVHGFVKLYSIHIAATAAVFDLEVSSGALLMLFGAIF